MVFKRNIYERLLRWKAQSNGSTALLVEGARRIGKSTIVEEFARNEYESYILINFGDEQSSYTEDVKYAFKHSANLNEFFTMLQMAASKPLYPRKSLIIFDEVQKNIKAREMIKQLVADGRYDYIETGSLISIKKNSRKIIIPSEEEKIEMFPMSFDEFLMACGEDALLTEIREKYVLQKPLPEILHRRAMKLFRTYMAVGGMPQAVCAYLENSSLDSVDRVKKNIINLYREDLEKISRKSSSVTPLIIYDRMQSLFSNHSFEITASSFSANTRLYTCLNNVDELEKSKIVNVAYDIRNVDPSLSAGTNQSGIKVYSGDTGLLVSKMFLNQSYLENELYKSIILDKLSVDQGFLFENVTAQMLRASGHSLKYSSFTIPDSKKSYSIDFLLSNGKKITPIEVKSSGYDSHHSFDEFCRRYHQYIDKQYIIYSKNLVVKEKYVLLPIYMAFCL